MIEEISLDDLDRARARQRLINAYHRTFASEDGRLVLADIKAVFGMDSPAFVAKDGGYDPLHAAIRDGQRQVALHVEAVMQEEAKGDSNVEAPEVTVETE